MQRIRSTIYQARLIAINRRKRTHPSPFDRLCVEIIVDIFYLVVATPSHALERQRPAHYGFPRNALDLQWTKINPLFLCAVCRRWRQIAFSAQELWGELRLQFKRSLKNGYERSLLQQWLERSGDTPLSLGIYRDLYRYPDRSRNMNAKNIPLVVSAMKEDLMPIMHRCKVIDVHRDVDDKASLGFAWVDIQRLLANDLSTLEEIRLWGRHSEAVDVGSCPRLHTLVCDWLTGQFRLVKIAQNSLSRLDTSASLNGVCDILSLFPSLVDVVFCFCLDAAWDEFFGPIRETTRFIHSRLESLFLRCMKVDSTDLWNMVTLPSLKVACLDLEASQDGTTLWRSLYSCFQRSHPPLVHLELYMNHPVPENELVEFLSWMPSLKSVRIELDEENSVITNTFWRALRGEYHDGPMMALESEGHFRASLINPPICPELEFLQLHVSNEADISEIRQTIIARFLDPTRSSSSSITGQSGFCSLKKLSVSIYGEHFEDLRSIMKSGGLAMSELSSRWGLKLHKRLVVQSRCAGTRSPMWRYPVRVSEFIC